MIYLLTSKSELKFSKIWQGHLEVVKAVLEINDSNYKQIDINQISNFKSNDIIINIGNHQYFGSKILNELGKKISKVGRTVFFMDDYQAPPATQLRKAIVGNSNLLITNFLEPVKRKSISMFKQVQVNLNKASFDLQPLVESSRPSAFIYWGSCRNGREDLFVRYFKPELYPTFVSASDRGHNRFTNMLLNYRPLPKMKNLLASLQNFGFTVMIQDAKQPKMNPPNRFYEAISAGLPIFFDYESDISNIPNANPYTVKNANEIFERIKNLKNLKLMQLEQRALLGQRNYRKELIIDLSKIFTEYYIL